MPRKKSVAENSDLVGWVHKIRKMPIAELKPAPYNPRKISNEALAGLEASMEKFGIVQPIIFNERTGFVVGGHQRLKILKRKKIAEIEVVVVDLDESDEKTLNVSLNNQHITGEFTDELQGLLSEIEQADEEIFSTLQLDKLLEEMSEDAEKPEPQYKNKFEVVVEVDSEEAQQDLYERLAAEGYTVKVLSI